MIYWICGGVIVLACAIGLEAYLRGNRPRRSMAERFGAKTKNDASDDTVPLGMEEIDFEVVARGEASNRAAASMSDRNRHTYPQGKPRKKAPDE